MSAQQPVKVVTVVKEKIVDSGSGWSGMDPSTLQSRMVESVNFAKELMQTNRELRSEVNGLAERCDASENENFHLQHENRELRDRIEILESVIASTNFGEAFDKLDWRQLFKHESQAPSVKTNNETINLIVDQLFTMRKETAKRDEANSALLSENQEMKQQLHQFKSQQAKLQQQKEAQRQAHMQNPYYAGFSSINEEPRDPFGGALKVRSNSKMSTSQYSAK